MLQILLNPDERYSLPEMAQMAVEAGCGWLRLGCAGLDDAALRDDAAEIARLCRESATILTFEGRIDLARQLGVHGCCLSGADALIKATALRAEWGPEAIIGAEVAGSDGASAAAAADLDFVSLPEGTSLADASKVIAAAASAGTAIPFVTMLPQADAASASAALVAGYAGVCVASEAFSHTDPEAGMSQLISELTKR